MVSAEMPCNRLGFFRLVVGRDMETNSKCLDWLEALCLHQRHHCRRVNPARKQSPQRHIREHASGDSIPQQSIETFDGFAIRHDKAVCPPCLDHSPCFPVWVNDWWLAKLDHRITPWQEFADSPIDRIRRRDITITQIRCQGIAVDLGRECWMGA